MPEQPVGRLVAGCLAHLLGEDGPVFDPVAVAVDDRVTEPGPDSLRVIFLARAHAFLRGVTGYSAAIFNPMS